MDASALHRMLDEARVTGTDIHEHVSTLMALAGSCHQIVEFGVCLGTSTLAFLAGGCDKLDSWDIDKTHMVDKIAAAAGDRWTFHHEDSRSEDVPRCDLLFIDSLHTREQLASELELHAWKAADRIVMHDTEEFGERGQDGGPGLRLAIIDFLLEHPDQWRVEDHYANNHGLTVLRRIG